MRFAHSWTVGDARITSIPEPGFELVLRQDAATTATLRAESAWLGPHFITDEGALRIGSSAVLVESSGLRIIVDPWLAFDAVDRASSEHVRRISRLFDALAETGTTREQIDVVVNTHIDGVGANTEPVRNRDGNAEVAGFPLARYIFSSEEIEALRARFRPRAEALLKLIDEGRIETVRGGEQITEDVSVEATPGHTRGHIVVNIASRGERAVIVGHLLLHPAQILAGERPDLDEDPARALETRRRLLDRWAAERALVIGPLFMPPGAGQLVRNGDRWRLEPAA